MTKTSTSEMLTVDEVAAELSVSGRTVRRWIQAGRLPAMKTKPLRGDYRIKRTDLDQFRKETLEK